MTQWWHVYLGVWITATVLSALLTYSCRLLAPQLGFLDRPLKEAHKQHQKAIPVLGGVAMLLAWLLTICIGLLFSAAFKQLFSSHFQDYLPGIQTVLPQLLWIVFGATGLVILGLLDDRFSLSALSKFSGQLVIVGAVACYGVRVTFFWQMPLITWAITTFWILLIINATNFFDNMDGLAAGTSVIAALIFTFVAGVREQYFVAVLGSVTCGVASGFLFHNRPPASIFMGDAGSHLLGYLLAVLGALTTFYTPGESPTPAPVLIPLLILGVPIFDLFAVVLMRLYHGQPIYVGDHTHISHRLTRQGLSRAQAVLVVYLLTFATGAGAVTLLWLPAIGTFVVFLQVAAILAIVSLLQFYGSASRTRSS